MNADGHSETVGPEYTDVEYTPEGYSFDEESYRWSDFLEIAGGDARYAAMLIDRCAPGAPEEGLHPETLVEQDVLDGEVFVLAGQPIVPEDIYKLPGTVRKLYSEIVGIVDDSGTVLSRDWRGFATGDDTDDVLREIEGAFGETEYSRAGTVFGAYAYNTFMSRQSREKYRVLDVTPLTPWEDEDGVAILSRNFNADSNKLIPCLWYCKRDDEQGFEVGGVKLDCSKVPFDEVAAAAASNGFDSVFGYLQESPSGAEPLCDVAVRRADAGLADAVMHFDRQDEALATLSRIAYCSIEAYGIDTDAFFASLDRSVYTKYDSFANVLTRSASGKNLDEERISLEEYYAARAARSAEEKPVPGEAASAAKKAAGRCGGDGAGDSGAIKQ